VHNTECPHPEFVQRTVSCESKDDIHAPQVEPSDKKWNVVVVAAVAVDAVDDEDDDVDDLESDNVSLGRARTEVPRLSRLDAKCIVIV